MSQSTDQSKQGLQHARGPDNNSQYRGGQRRPRQPRDPDKPYNNYNRGNGSQYRGNQQNNSRMYAIENQLKTVLGVLGQMTGNKNLAKPQTNQQQSNSQGNKPQAQGQSQRQNNRKEFFNRNQGSQDWAAAQRDEERKQGFFRQPAKSVVRIDNRQVFAPKDTAPKSTNNQQLDKAVPVHVLARGTSAHTPSTLPMSGGQNNENPQQVQSKEFDPKMDPRTLVDNLAKAAQSKITFEQVENGLNPHKVYLNEPEADCKYDMEPDPQDKDLVWVQSGDTKVGVKTSYPPAKLKQQVFGMLQRYSPETFSLFKNGKLSIKMPEERKFSYRALYTSPIEPDLVKPMEMQLDAMLKAGYIRVPEKDEEAYFQVPLKPVLKENGALRLVCDARELNEMFSAPTTEMPTPLQPLAQFTDRWMTKIDIKEAFMHVELDKDFQRWFGFSFQGKEYFMCRMGFGWCMASYIFQQIMNAVSVEIHKRWKDLLYNNPFADDAIMIGQNQNQHRANTVEVRDFYVDCGFEINYEKSVLEPCQSIDWIGFHYHANGISIATRSKDKILASFKQFKQDGTYGTLISLLGMLNWAATIHLPWRPILSIIMRKINPFVRVNPMLYEWKVSRQLELTQVLEQHLTPLVEGIVQRTAFRPTIKKTTFCFFVDATPQMFGFASPMTSSKYQMESIKGEDCHINQHELEAMTQVIANCPDDSNLMIYSDSNTVVESMSRGTSTSDKLCFMLVDIFNLMAVKNISVIVRYINTKDNPADEPSRRMLPKDRKCALRDMFIPCRMKAHQFTWENYLDFLTKNQANKAQPKIIQCMLAILANQKLGVQLIMRYPKKVLETDYFYEGYPPVLLTKAYKAFLIQKQKSKGKLRQWPLIRQIGQRLVEAGCLTKEEVTKAPTREQLQQPIAYEPPQDVDLNNPAAVKRAERLKEIWGQVSGNKQGALNFKDNLKEPADEEEEKKKKKKFYGLASNDNYHPDGKPPDDDDDFDDFYDGDGGGDPSAFHPVNHPSLRPFFGKPDLGLGQQMHQASQSKEAEALHKEVENLMVFVNHLAARIKDQEQEIHYLQQEHQATAGGDQEDLQRQKEILNGRIDQLRKQHSIDHALAQGKIKDLEQLYKSASELNNMNDERLLKMKKLEKRVERLEGKKLKDIDLDVMPERPMEVPANEKEALLLEQIRSLEINQEIDIKALEDKHKLELTKLQEQHEKASDAERVQFKEELNQLNEEHAQDLLDLNKDHEKVTKEKDLKRNSEADALTGEIARLKEELAKKDEAIAKVTRDNQEIQAKHAKLNSLVLPILSLVDCKRGDLAQQMQDSHIAISKLLVDKQEALSTVALQRTKINDQTSHIDMLKEKVTLATQREEQEKTRHTLEVQSKLKMILLAEDKLHLAQKNIIELQETLSRTEFDRADKSTEAAVMEAEKLRAQLRDSQLKSSKELQDLHDKTFALQEKALKNENMIQELENTLRMEKAETKVAQDKNSATNKMLQEVQKKLQTAEENSTKLTLEIQNLKLSQGDTNTQIRDLTNKIQGASKRNEELQTKIRTHEQELHQLKEKALTEQHKQESDQAVINNLTTRCTQLQQFSTTLITTVKKEQGQVAHLSHQLFRDQFDLSLKEMKIEALINHETDLDSIIATLAPETAKLDEQLGRINLELATAQLQAKRAYGNYVLQFKLRKRLEEHWEQRETQFLAYDAFVQALMQQVVFFIQGHSLSNDGYMFIHGNDFEVNKRQVQACDWKLKETKPPKIAIEQQPIPDITPTDKDFINIPNCQILDPTLGEKDVQQQIVLKEILNDEDVTMWAETIDGLNSGGKQEESKGDFQVIKKKPKKRSSTTATAAEIPITFVKKAISKPATPAKSTKVKFINMMDEYDTEDATHD